ncbi:conserved hypothetical protein, partial [Ricinus communis]
DDLARLRAGAGIEEQDRCRSLVGIGLAHHRETAAGRVVGRAVEAAGAALEALDGLQRRRMEQDDVAPGGPGDAEVELRRERGGVAVLAVLECLDHLAGAGVVDVQAIRAVRDEQAAALRIERVVVPTRVAALDRDHLLQVVAGLAGSARAGARAQDERGRGQAVVDCLMHVFSLPLSVV